jgi:hypothetical protein
MCVMAIRTQRRVLDFRVENYRSDKPKVELLDDEDWQERLEAERAKKKKKKEDDDPECVFRWYCSLQGEEHPVTASDPSAREAVYRYDWAFGITVLRGFWWDWQAELRAESTIAVQLLIEPREDPPEPLPVSATLSGLLPSRNTRSFWEQLTTKLPGAAADVAKAGEWAIPHLGMVSSPLVLASTVLESQSAGKKNWFMYQFLDEDRNCPCVEWRITKNALKEYGPLLRGSLFLLFPSGGANEQAHVRLTLRPLIGYYEADEICYIDPSREFSDAQQLSLDIAARHRRDEE